MSNAGWLDAAAMEGMRASFEQEFSSIYIFNLRGNQRVQGEMSRREGGKIFGSGSRTPIAITVLVKNPKKQREKAVIRYVDIGDYLSREEKLKKIADMRSCLSAKFKEAARTIHPNEHSDWINKRSGLFATFVPLVPEKNFNVNSQSFFSIMSLGICSNRDAWVYDFSKQETEHNIRETISYYNACIGKKQDMDATHISWTATLENLHEDGKRIRYEEEFIPSFYRPFTKHWLYWGEKLIHRRRLMDDLFPTKQAENLLICISGMGSLKDFGALITDKISNVDFLEKTRCLPLYYYEKPEQGDLFSKTDEGYIRHDGITDFIRDQAKTLYGKNVTKEDIFYYVYGFLHIPAYREKFAADLKKSLPRIILVKDVATFWQISKAGRALADLHLNYEEQTPPASVQVIGAETGDFHVQKLKFKKHGKEVDKTTLIYNDHITITNLSLRAYNYVVNGRSPIEWVIDRYQIKVDKASGIKNDPNKWGEEHGKPRYILDLILSLVTVSLRTLDIIATLPELPELNTPANP